MSRLRATLSPLLASFLDSQSTRLFEWIDALGSPLLLLFPNSVQANIKAFRTALRQAGVSGDILFAAKVNKARSLLAAVSASGAGVDVASEAELGLALGLGVQGDMIGVSGPEKPPGFLYSAVRHGCMIAVDSPQELESIAELCRRMQVASPARVLLRVNSTSHARKGDDERFGSTPTEISKVLGLTRETDYKRLLSVVGFSFHHDNHSIESRIASVHTCLDLIVEARRLGHDATILNIGGGIPCQYVDRNDWVHFAREQFEHTISGRSNNYRERDLEFRESNGRCESHLLYPHGVQSFKDEFLAALLAAPEQSSGNRIGDVLRERHIRLLLEPGRSLLDQSGLTVCRVMDTKFSAQGRSLVQCELTSFSMWDQLIGSEFAVDPILLHREGAEIDGQVPFLGHIVGNSCLESDVIAWRAVEFPSRPRKGDLLVFVNTAGYQMDFAETTVHGRPTPMRIAILFEEASYRWKLDREVSPVDFALTASVTGDVVRSLAAMAACKPRYTPGDFHFPFGSIEYVDAFTLAIQYREIFVDRLYDVQVDSSTPTILDCGANIGLSVIRFKQLFPGAQITAFEADPIIFKVLQRNVLRHCPEDVTLVSAAVWVTTGEERFDSEGSEGGRLCEHGTTIVTTTRLADYLRSEIDILKLDIEGAEWTVLCDLIETGTIRFVRRLIVEFHGWPEPARKFGSILDSLIQAGFRVTFPWSYCEPLLENVRHQTPFPFAHDEKFILFMYAWKDKG